MDASSPPSPRPDGRRRPGGPPRRPDPAEVRAAALAWPHRASAAYALVLGALAVGAPDWTGGDPLAALLPGVPGALVALLFVLGRPARRRRVTMSLATAVAGFLALTTVSSLGAVDRLGEDGGAAVAFQLACLGASAVFLAISAPAWRRVEREGGEADALLRMYDEL